MAQLTKKEKQQLAKLLDVQWHGVKKAPEGDSVPFANYAGMFRVIDALGLLCERGEDGRHIIG